MFASIFGALESGIIFAIMALGVYLSFRVLDFPDLTVDGSFVTGAGTAAAMITRGLDPILATACGMLAGFIAGCFTGLLHTKGKIHALLSGILMMIALWSINLRIMEDAANIPLLGKHTLMTEMADFAKITGLDASLNAALKAVGLGESLPRTWGILVLMLALTLIIKMLNDWFLQTEIGLALRATGDNKRMSRSFSANTDRLTILGLGLANAWVALSGAIYAQYGGFADIGMGVGMIIVGLASVIIGEALFGTKTIARTTLAVIGGAILYRIVVTLALRIEFFKPGDLKLITAVIVVLALVVPKAVDNRREKRRRKRRQAPADDWKREAEQRAAT